MWFTAEHAAKLVAPYVGMQWPENKDKIFSLLTLVNDRIWNEGTWWGMSKEFYVNTYQGPFGEHYITCPPGYEILLAVNVDGVPSLQRGKWFQFHKNSFGDIDHCCGNWTDSVVDLGEFATINDIYPCPLARPSSPIIIGATVVGSEPQTPLLTISGSWDRGEPVYTFKNIERSSREIEVLNEPRQLEPVYGMQIALNEKIRMAENVWWKNVTAIKKDRKTVNRIEVYAFHQDTADDAEEGACTCTDQMQLLAVLEPHQLISRYRRYLVPKECGCPQTIHGMFKISEPDDICYPTQQIITRSREGLIAFAIAMDFKYNKKDPERAIPYLIDGIKALEDNNRENESKDTFPVQVTGPYIDEIPPEYESWQINV